MPFEGLTERERAVLKALIVHYTRTAQPVGSRALAKEHDLGVSPATIRNVCQDLEERGMLAQPHTSAGRVPTELAYREYVATMLTLDDLSEEESTELRRLRRSAAAIDELLDETSRVLGEMSKRLGVSLGPTLEKGVVSRIQVVRVGERRVMVVVALRAGIARTVVIECESELPERSVQRAEEILNERLAGLTLGEIRTTLRERFADIDPAGGTLVRLILDRADDAFATGRSEDVHIGGTAELLAQPEFSDRQRVQAILEFVEDRTELARVVAQRPGAGVTITFGTELGADEMSLVSAPYSAGQMTGVIGVLGPSRMPYSRMVPLVDKVSRLLTELLSE